jgi:hypothetical protein
MDVPDDRGERRAQADMADDEMERLRTVLYQALDEWLRLYIVNQFKNITAQPGDPNAVDRALTGAVTAIKGWRRGRSIVAAMGQKTT